MPTFCNRLGNRGTSLVYDSDVAARYDVTNANAIIVDNSNRIKSLLDVNGKMQIGTEKVTNGDFSNGATGWTFVQPVVGIVEVLNNSLHIQSVDGSSAVAFQLNIKTTNKVYKLEFDIVGTTSGVIQFGDTSSEYQLASGSSGHISTYFVSVESSLRIKRAGVCDATLDNISVKEVLGNHLVQTNISYMPLLSTTLPHYATFDGTNDIQSKAFTLGQPCTVYTVFKQKTFTAGDYLYDGNTAGSLQCSQVTSAGNLSIGSGGTSFNNMSKSSIGVYDIMCNVYNGASSSSKINNLTKATGTVGSVNAAGFVLGSKSTPSDYGNLEVKEIIIRNGADSDLMQSAIMNYLYYKHNITY